MTRNGKFGRQFALLLICLFWLWFHGVSHLKRLPIANDEVNTVARIRHLGLDQPFSLAETLDKLAGISPDHGPLYFALLNLWQRVAGGDLFAMRLPSVFFGMLSLAVAWRVARLGGGGWASLTAVALLAFQPFFLYYAHTARMYTLLALTAGGMVWSYWRASAARAKPKPGLWLLLFVSSAAITYIHYAGVILLAAAGLHHLAFAEKGARWWRVAAVMLGAGLSFVGWLPVALEGMTASSVLTETRLSWHGALGAGFAVFANGIVILPVIASVLILRYRKRLKRAQRYILLVLGFALLALLALNEFTPLLVESRLRYLTFIAAPAAAALAWGLEFLLARKPLRIVFVCLWIGAAVAFAHSSAFEVYTNRRALDEDQLVQYQAFKYDLRGVPGYDQLIISFHQGAPAVWKAIEYYRHILDDWKSVAHFTYDAAGQLRIESGDPAEATLADIAAGNDGLWTIHNPAQTDLAAMAVYSDWFLAHYRPCKRFVDAPDKVIEFALRRGIPCELVFAEEPLALRYDNGMELDNVLVEASAAALDVYFWWRAILPGEFSFSLQVYDQAASRALGEDAVISRAPLDARRLDIAALPPGDYSLQLIVYDFATGQSLAGAISGTGERVEREVEIARFSV